MVWDKDSLIGQKRKGNNGDDEDENIQFYTMQLLTTCWLMPSQTLSSGPHHWPAPHSVIAEQDAPWHGTSLWPVGVSCPGSVPSSCCTPSLPAGRAPQEAEKSLAPCKHCSAQIKHRCVISIILTLYPKYDTIPATRTTIPIKTRHILV